MTKRRIFISSLFLIWIAAFFTYTPCADLFHFFKEPALDLNIPLQTNHFPPKLQKKLSHPYVYLTETDEGERYVIKELSPRTLGERIRTWRLLAHEYNILRAVQEVPGTVKLIGKLSPKAFGIGYISYIDPRDCTTEELLLVKERIFNTLSELHAKGIYHRDLRNPTNILITDNLTPILIDFANATKLSSFFKPIFGPLLAYRDKMDLLKFFFLINRNTLNNKELDDLYFFRRLKRSFQTKNRPDSLVDEIRVYRASCA
jgi:serine/threonine protein kinase